MSVDSEESLEDGLGVGEEVVGEGDSNLAGEQVLVVQLILDPGHQEVYILGSGTFYGLLHLVAVSPVVLKILMMRFESIIETFHLIFGTSGHDST